MKRNKRAKDRRRGGDDSDDSDGSDELNDAKKGNATTNKTKESNAPKRPTKESGVKSIFDDEDFIAKPIQKSSSTLAKNKAKGSDKSKFSTQQKSFSKSANKKTSTINDLHDDNDNGTDAEYRKFVEEQKKYFESVDSYCLTVEKDTSITSLDSDAKQKSFVSPIKANEDDTRDNSSGSLPPSTKKRRRNTQLNLISPIKSGNSSLSRTGRSGDQGQDEENSYDDSFDREIESEFMSQSKSKSRIENSFDSLNMSPLKK